MPAGPHPEPMACKVGSSNHGIKLILTADWSERVANIDGDEEIHRCGGKSTPSREQAGSHRPGSAPPWFFFSLILSRFMLYLQIANRVFIGFVMFE